MCPVQLLEDSHTLRYTPDDVRSSCILIMGSLTAISYQLGSLTIQLPAKAAKVGMLQSNEFNFNQVYFFYYIIYTPIVYQC